MTPAGLSDAEDGLSAAGDATDYAHTQVRDAILQGRLAPDEEFSQVRLARELGVSRTPLREALRMLQKEGLVEARHNRSVRVASLSDHDAESLYVARVTMEAMAIRIAVPRMTTQDVALAQGQLAEMNHLVAAGEFELWERTHRTFHSRLVVNAGERIAALLEELSAHAKRYRRVVATEAPRAWSTSADEHRAIVEACAAGDPDTAAARLAEHLARTGFTVISLLDPAYEPDALRTAVAAMTTRMGTA